MKSLYQLIVEYSLGLKDPESVQVCILSWIDRDPCIPDLAYTVCGSNHRDTERALFAIANYVDKDFSLTNLISEQASASVLVSQGKLYLNGEISAIEFCRIVQEFDIRFMETSNFKLSWLGDLYNQCDWCDETWSLNSTPHLTNYLQEHLLSVERWLISL